MEFDTLECTIETTRPPLGEAALTLRRRLEQALHHTQRFSWVEPEVFLAEFEAHWGTCTIPNLAAVAAQYAPLPSEEAMECEDVIPSESLSDDEVRLLTILFLLGVRPSHYNAGEARAALLPFLSSPHPLRRWASAISLGYLKDMQALPTLLHMLTEFWPTERGVYDLWSWQHYAEAWDDEHSFDGYINNWRPEVPHLLWRLADRSAIPALRQTLRAAVEMERFFPPLTRYDGDHYTPEFPTFTHDRDHWIAYQDHLIFALGRFKAFGSLMEIPAPEEDPRSFWLADLASIADAEDEAAESPQDTGGAIVVEKRVVKRNMATARSAMWRVHLCRASIGWRELQGKYHVTWEETPDLRDAVARLLQDVFGLSAAEQEEALAHYQDASLLGDMNMSDFTVANWVAETGEQIE